MASAQKLPVIPGIDLSALDAISDRNVRDVLRALVDGWHVRNGSAGNGENRFVTAAEVGLSKGRPTMPAGGGYGNNASNPGNTTIRPADVARIINDLQAQVIESPLFKELGRRVDLIDQPGGLIAGQAAESTFRTGSDNALAEAVNKIWSSVGDNSALVEGGSQVISNSAGAAASRWNQTQAAIKDEDGNYISSAAVRQTASTAVNKLGEIELKWVVNMDGGGLATGFRQAGFGMIGSGAESGPTYAFGVRADNFWIASPGQDGVEAPPPDQVPFIVRTTGSTINGVYVPAGTYIKDAFIGTITGEKITAKSITADQIAANAITAGMIRADTIVTDNLVSDALTEADDFPSGVVHGTAFSVTRTSKVMLLFSLPGPAGGQWDQSRLYSCGVQGVRVASTFTAGPATTMAVSMTLPPGTYYIHFQVAVWLEGESGGSWGSSVNITTLTGSCFILKVKK